MTRTIRGWSVCVFLALAVSLSTAPASASGAEASFLSLAAAEEAPAPAVCLEEEIAAKPSEDRQYTLEEIIDMFGAHRVCNIPCGGIPHVNCTQRCGDAAGCFNGHCLYH